MSCEIAKLDTSHLASSLSDFHRVCDLPVTGTHAENVLVKWLAANGLPVTWRQGSHKPGSDLFVRNLSGMSANISVKSCKRSPRGKEFRISSYRTTSQTSISDKVAAIRQVEKNIDSYLLFARVERKVFKRPERETVYVLYLLNPDLLAIDSFRDWRQDDKGHFHGRNNQNVILKIAANMSAQVWYTVPTALLDDPALVTEVYRSDVYKVKLWE